MLERLGAADQLIGHARYVCEAANALMNELRTESFLMDERVVDAGSVLHDAGQIVHPEELSQPGALHEATGEALLLRHDVQGEIARCWRSHGTWAAPDVPLEERLVVLADKP